MMRRTAIALLLAGASLLASSTESWEMNTYADFMRGRFSGVSLTRDGRIVLAPRLTPLFSSDEPSIWTVAEAPDGALYVGTGHRGRLYRIDRTGKSTLVWTAPEPEIFAVTVAPDGSVFAGTSPSGKVYRIRNDVAEEYFAPNTRYIWALLVAKDGALYVGSGDDGKIFRVTGKGVGEVWFETGQSHVTALTQDRNGRVLAGTDPNGLIYRLDAKDKAFVLYDAEFPEIRTLVSAPDGTVYAAALGGSVQQRTNAAAAGQSGTQTPAVTTPTITVTVTDEAAAAQSPPEIKPKPPEGSKPAAPQAAVPGQTVYSATGGAVDMTGVDKSALYRIRPDNTVEALWTSKDENIYDVLLSGSQVLFSTDANGRIYRMNPDRQVTLIAQTNEGETTRLLISAGSIVAATGTMGKLYRLSESATADGSYESPVHDAGNVARWGQLTWRGERKGSAKLAFRTRSGNSARPDRTWSEWSAPHIDPKGDSKGSNVTSPNARFIQWKAEFAGETAASPLVSGVTLAYLPQNNPPIIRSLNVTTLVTPTPAGGKAAAPTASAGTYSITVTDTGEAGASTLSGTPSQTLTRGYTQQIQVIWHAEDPDSDKLVYAIYFRGEDESQWKLLRENFNETMLTLEGDVLADGRYLFRVLASDRASNSGETAREAELVSSPVLFDATPPVVTATASERSGPAAKISLRAVDAASSLRRAEYSVDAANWLPLDSADGVVDGQEEAFEVRVDKLTAGEHIVVVRVYDASSNVGLTKIVLR